MKAGKDLFSSHSGIYQKYRPEYPESMIFRILSHCPDLTCAWDAGTGNGQVAKLLSTHFLHVDATDLSSEQLARAPRIKNIRYRKSPASEPVFETNRFDLITVAQALHWFDLSLFFKEVQRVLKPNGILAVWGYDLLRIDPEIDTLLKRFYEESVGEHWAPERHYVETHYRTIQVPLMEIGEENNYRLERRLNLDQYCGYLYSWSATQTCIRKTETDPVPEFREKLIRFWKPHEIKVGNHPVFIRIFKNVLKN